jgi:plastocyanin
MAHVSTRLRSGLAIPIAGALALAACAPALERERPSPEPPPAAAPPVEEAEAGDAAAARAGDEQSGEESTTSDRDTETRSQPSPTAEPDDAPESDRSASASQPPAPDKAPAADPRQTPEPGASDGDAQAQGADQAADTPAPADSDGPAEPAASPAPAARAQISGRVVLTGGDADADEAIVYFVPDTPGRQGEAAEGAAGARIVTRDKSLEPTVLTVSPGTEVHFPNEDPILHNLFSVSAGNDFDLGVYGPGESPSVRFDETGVVNIYCNVHHDMHAHVLVVDTPWRTRADADGRFRLTDLPSGEGELHIWHRQSKPWSRRVRLPASDSFNVRMEVTKPRLPPHRDKGGEPYNRRNRDPYG